MTPAAPTRPVWVVRHGATNRAPQCPRIPDSRLVELLDKDVPTFEPGTQTPQPCHCGCVGVKISYWVRRPARPPRTPGWAAGVEPWPEAS